LHCCSGAFTAFTNKSYFTLQTALSSLLNEAGGGPTTKQHQILQYDANLKNNEATCCFKKFDPGG